MREAKEQDDMWSAGKGAGPRCLLDGCRRLIKRERYNEMSQVPFR